MSNKPKLTPIQWYLLLDAIAAVVHRSPTDDAPDASGYDVIMRIAVTVLGASRASSLLSGSGIDVSKVETARLVVALSEVLPVKTALSVTIRVLGEKLVNELLVYAADSLKPDPAPVDPEEPLVVVPATPNSLEDYLVSYSDLNGYGALWKPISESDGKLVTLHDSDSRKKIIRCTIQQGATVIETGRFSGDEKNGSRTHHRWNKPGNGYPAGCQLVYYIRASSDPSDNRVWIISYYVGHAGDRIEWSSPTGIIDPSGRVVKNSLGGMAEKPWRLAQTPIRAAMITPMLVNNSLPAVKAQAAQVAASSNFNAVASLVDLQSGRSYIFPGRTATALDQRTEKNIRAVLDAGVTPILIIRNDWAARSGKGIIPSVGQTIENDAFYSPARLETERQFLFSLRWLYPYIHIQLSIEPSSILAAQFALRLAGYMRAEGFQNAIIVNPYSTSVAAHVRLREELSDLGVIWARSQNSGTVTDDEVFNSDGNKSINQASFGGFMRAVRSSGKPYIIWCDDFAAASDVIPGAYMS